MIDYTEQIINKQKQNQICHKVKDGNHVIIPFLQPTSFGCKVNN